MTDHIKELGLNERVRLFGVGFDDLTDLYVERDDGYIQQSIVQVVEQLTPSIALIFAVVDDDGSRQ